MKDFSAQPIFVSSVMDELRNKQHFFETSEVDKVRRLTYPHHWLLRDLAQMNAFQKTFFSLLAVLDTNNTTN